MNFLKSAHSLFFKMLKNAGKNWKVLFTLIIPRALNFSAFSRDLLQGRSTPGLFCCARAFQIIFREQAVCLVFRVLISLSVSSAELELVMDVEPTVCLSTANVDVVCVAPKKKARVSPGLYLYRRGDGCFFFLSCRATRRRSGTLTKAIEAGLMKRLRSARQQSPFFTMVIRDEWLVSFDFAIVIHSIHSMLKNSIHSIQKLMNGPTGGSEKKTTR